MKECICLTEEGDKLIAEGDGESGGPSVPQQVFPTDCGIQRIQQKIKNSMEDLPESKLFINELCAHIFIESRQAKSLANDLYSRLFEKYLLISRRYLFSAENTEEA